MRVPSQVQQPRMPYGSYPQGDYTAYYTGPSAHIDYSYAYDAYRATSDPSLYASSPALSAAVAAAPSMYPGVGPHPHPIAEMHSQQPGVFYDFSGSSRALPSQYYYPPQPLVYHHPMDKKRGNQVSHSSVFVNAYEKADDMKSNPAYLILLRALSMLTSNRRHNLILRLTLRPWTFTLSIP